MERDGAGGLGPDPVQTLEHRLGLIALQLIGGEVLEELPSRTEITLQVEMNDEEQAFYEANRRQALENIGGWDSGTGAAGRRNASPVTVNRAIQLDDLDRDSALIKIPFRDPRVFCRDPDL